MTKRTLLGTFLGLALICSAEAAVVLSEPFSYGNGFLTTVGSTVWSVHSGAGSNPITVTNGMIRVVGGTGEDVNASLAGAPYLETDSGAVLYSSYTIVISNTAGLPTAGGTYISHFRGTNIDAATDYGARVWISTSNRIANTTLPAGTFRLGIANGTSGNGGSGQFDLDLGTGTNNIVVTKFVPSTGLATIWINPTSEGSTSVTATDIGTVTRPNPFNVFTYAFRQASGGGTVYIDDLRVGTTFNDVFGANSSPVLSGISSQSGPASAPVGPIPFTVSDAETPASSLTVTGSSSNDGLVPDANVVISGSDTNRTVTINPVSGQEGTTVITITASDGVSSAFINFTVRIGFPTISGVDDQIIMTNTSTAALPFTVGDAETPGSLNVTGSSSNPGLVPDANIVISGTGTSRTVTVTPVANQSGQSTITLSVSDGVNLSTETFVLTVAPYYGLLLADTFTYPDGWIGNTAFWVPHSGNSNDTFVVNNQLTLAQTNTDDVSAYFSNTFEVVATSGAVLYSSFKANFSALPKNNNGTYFAHFRDTGTSNFKGRVFAATNGAPTGQFRMGIANGNNSPVMLPMNLDLNTTYNVVTRYNVGSGVARLWVNPANENSASATGSDVTSAVNIWTYAFRQEGISGSVGAVITIDDLKIGSVFSDVSAVSPDSIPLNIQNNGNGTVTLTWSDPVFKLQERSDLSTGSWTTLGSATTGYTVSSSGNKFYRLIWTP